MTLVDTNVLLDLVGEESVWTDWSLYSLAAAAERGPLLINDVIYAEASIRFAAAEVLDHTLETLGMTLAPIGRPALFAAGKAHQRYRAVKGLQTSILPDFFIGAHAQALECPLLTRDVRRYRTYFPDVRLITP